MTDRALRRLRPLLMQATTVSQERAVADWQNEVGLARETDAAQTLADLEAEEARLWRRYTRALRKELADALLTPLSRVEADATLMALVRR